jgi:hypothetical protein
MRGACKWPRFGRLRYQWGGGGVDGGGPDSLCPQRSTVWGGETEVCETSVSHQSPYTMLSGSIVVGSLLVPTAVGVAGATPLQAPSMYLRPPRCYGDALRAIGDHVARARYVLSNIEAAVLVSPHSIVEVRIPGSMSPALCGQPGTKGTACELVGFLVTPHSLSTHVVLTFCASCACPVACVHAPL